MSKQRKIQYGTFSGSTLHTMTSIKSRAIKLAEKTRRQAVKLMPNGWIVSMKNEPINLAWK